MQNAVKDVAVATLSDASAHLVTTVDGIMQSVAKAFPEVGGKGFEFYAKYVLATGVSDLACAGIELLMLGVLIYFIRRIANALDKATSSSDELGAICASVMVAGIVGFILSICILSNVASGITKIIAPEGAVIKEIISNLPRS